MARQFAVEFVAKAVGWGKASGEAQAGIRRTSTAAEQGAAQFARSQDVMTRAAAGAAAKVEQAQARQADAAVKVTIEQKRLAEAQKRYGEDSSQAAAAQLKLTQAQRSASAASGAVTKATEGLERAQSRLAEVTDQAAADADRSGSRWTRFSGAVGKVQEKLRNAIPGAEKYGREVNGIRTEQSRRELSLLEKSVIAGAGAFSGAALAKGAIGGIRAVASSVSSALSSVTGAVFGGGFERLKSIDQATASLRGLGHEAGTIDTIMANATASVKGTALGLGEAAGVAASSVAAGIKPGADLERTLKLVADAATIGGASMGEMGMIFNKVAAKGKVDGDILNQLMERQIPITGLLAEQLGVSQSEVAKLVSEGKVGFAEFQAAMELGMGGAALESADTFSGALSNVRASLGRIGANILGAAFDQAPGAFQGVTDALGVLEEKAKIVGAAVGDFVSGLVSGGDGLEGWAAKGAGVRDMLERIGAALGWMRDHPGILTGVAAAFGVLTAAVIAANVAMWVLSLNPVSLIVMGIVVAVAALTAGIVVLVRNWDTVWGAIRSAASSVAGWFTGTVVPMFAGVWDAIVGGFRAAGEWISGVWDSITGAFSAAWEWVSGVFLGWWEGLVARISGPLTTAWKILQVLGAAIVLVFEWLWAQVVRIVAGLVDAVVSRFWSIVSFWSAIGAALWAAIVAVWQRIVGWLSPYVEALVGFVASRWENLKQNTTAVFTAIWSVLSGIWETIRSTVTGVVDRIRSSVTERWESLSSSVTGTVTGMKDRVLGVFDGLQAGIASVWDKIKGGMSAPVRWVADNVVNPLIRQFNKLADKVGMPNNKLGEWTFQGFKSGGVYGGDGRVMPGYTPGRDVHRFWSPTGGGLALSGGEAIMRPEWTRAVGGPAEVARMNRDARAGRLSAAGRRADHRNRIPHGLGRGDGLRSHARHTERFASGGVWWPTNTRRLSGNYSGHTGVDIAAGMGAPVWAMTPGTVTHAGWGRGFGMAVFQRLVNGMEAVYGHLSSVAVSRGQQVTAGQLLGNVGSTGRSTGPHLHVEVTAAGRLGNAANRAGTLSFLGGADVNGVTDTGAWWDVLGDFVGTTRGLVDKVRDLGTDGWSGLIGRLPGMAWEGLKSFVSDKWSAVTGAIGDASVKAQVRAVAASFGWGAGDQWDAIDYIVSRESGWDPKAANPTSSARGLFQKMTSIWGPVESTAAGQTRWGLGYIRDRYKTPTAARAFWERNRWYDQGSAGAGRLPTGTSLVTNRTGRSELVLNGPQEHVVEEALRTIRDARTGAYGGAYAGRGGDTQVVHIEKVDTNDAEDVAAATLEALATHRRRRRALGVRG